MINLNKSSLNFSNNVMEDTKAKVRNWLPHRVENNTTMYLGLPTKIVRSKQSDFGYVLDKIRENIYGWKEKCLSYASQTILVIALAIPTYDMSVFKFPTNFCNDNDIIIRNYWWGEKGDERKIHWINWNKMCHIKDIIGLGFRNLSLFSDALCWFFSDWLHYSK